MNIKIHAKAYRSQCSSFNLCFTLFTKQVGILTIEDLFRTRKGHVSLYINVKSEVGLFGRVPVQVTSVANWRAAISRLQP